MNLYYSLPNGIIYEINKRVFSMEVLPKIKKIIPKGDFSFMIPEGSNSNWDRIFVRILSDYYSLLHEIGPEAWEYLYSKRYHCTIISDDTIWLMIRTKLISKYGLIFFDRGIKVMQHIARTGWIQFVKEYLIAQQLSNNNNIII